MAQPLLLSWGDELYVHEMGTVQAHRSSLASPLISRSASHAFFKLWILKFKQGNLYQGNQGYIRALEQRVFISSERVLLTVI